MPSLLAVRLPLLWRVVGDVVRLLFVDGAASSVPRLFATVTVAAFLLPVLFKARRRQTDLSGLSAPFSLVFAALGTLLGAGLSAERA